MAAPIKKRRACSSEEPGNVFTNSGSFYSGSESDSGQRQFLDDDESNGKNDSEFSVHNISDIDTNSSHDSNNTNWLRRPSQQRRPVSGDNVNATVNSWKWQKKNDIPINYAFTGSSGCKVPHLNADSSALEIFQEFWTSDLILKIAEETNTYADANPKRANQFKRSHNIVWTPVTPDEIKAFLAMTVLMGIVHKPELDMYWSRDPVLETPFFPETIPRTRFRDILSKLHFNRNENDDQTDQLYKLRPVIDSLVDKCRTVYIPTQNISIDESFIKFHGKRRAKFKQYNNSSKQAHLDVKVYKLNQFQALPLVIRGTLRLVQARRQ